MVKTIELVVRKNLKSHRKKDEQSNKYYKIEEKMSLLSVWFYKIKQSECRN